MYLPTSTNRVLSGLQAPAEAAARRLEMLAALPLLDPREEGAELAQALIEANRTFDLLIMPGQPHGPQGAAGRYYREDVRRFMAAHLLGEEHR